MDHEANNDGFSLVELSIVLVILGLLIGGVLTGQNLIRAAELRAVSTEYNNWQTAVNVFKEKYLALPGDITNATRFWGDNATHCADAAITDGTPGTCNGNGDGQLALAAAASQEGERFMFWQHMANAGLIEGIYTGLAGSGSNTHTVIGTNAPRSKISGAGWGARWLGSYTDVSFFQSDYGNIFVYGAQSTIDLPAIGALLPEEAWNIDTKMDDGSPASGMVMAGKLASTYFTPNCSTTNADATAQYALTRTTKDCALIFKTKF